MDVKSIVFARRKEILAICERYGARNVRIFGSVARGDARPESDVDIIVQFEPGRTLLDHAALLLELRNLLGVNVDVITERGLRPRIRERVLQEAVAL